MTDIVTEIASTRPIRQSSITTVLTANALNSFVEQVHGPRAIRMSVDHDPFCCPTGKIVDAWTEPDGDELVLLVRFHVEEHGTFEFHPQSGTELVHLSFTEHPKPFSKRTGGDTHRERISITYDPANFPDPSAFEIFESGAKEIDDGIEVQQMGRFALTPEPILQFVVEHPVWSAAIAFVVGSSTKFFTYTIDATLKGIANEFGEQLSNKLVAALKLFHKSATTDPRSTLLEVVFAGDLEIVLLLRQEANAIPERICLADLFEEMEAYGDLLKHADSATFSYSSDENWQFEYLTTKTGRVIGSKTCYERTISMRESALRRQDG